VCKSLKRGSILDPIFEAKMTLIRVSTWAIAVEEEKREKIVIKINTEMKKIWKEGFLFMM
jgi:hypothetical protein